MRFGNGIKSEREGKGKEVGLQGGKEMKVSKTLEAVTPCRVSPKIWLEKLCSPLFSKRRKVFMDVW